MVQQTILSTRHQRMRLLVLSDLHLEFGDFAPLETRADVVVLAGDIWHRERGITWAARHFPPSRTLYVLGNHEFYGEEVNDVVAACRQAAGVTGLHLLENDAVVIGGVRFLGAALWTDFRLFGDSLQPNAMRDAAVLMNDFRLIAIAEPRGGRRVLRPTDTLAIHAASRAYLAAELAKSFAGETVVVTHFLPHARSVAPQYARDRLTPAFCSDLSHLIVRHAPALWIHGHTHESFDYRVGRTRVVCNPRGYYPDELNPRFDPGLIVEV